jgi:hypothetical protein
MITTKEKFSYIYKRERKEINHIIAKSSNPKGRQYERKKETKYLQNRN